MTPVLACAAVDFAYDAEDEAFRAELQAWLDANLPDFVDQGEIGDGGGDGTGRADATTRTMARRRAWQQRLHEGRWAAINWPVEWGGREATTMQNVVYAEVMARAKAPGIYNANGIWQIGPMILRWGTDEQKQRWLPGILDASVHWCQGFSEPEAGSDLANLRTTAVADGDEYVVNGTKIWTSTAHLAKWGLFLVRTDPTAIGRGAKHEGITALIVDLEAPGVRCTPIREITGEAMFDEVVFDDARVPVAYRLGAEGEGWTVAMGTLTSERAGTGSIAIGMRAELDAMIAAARERNPTALDDPDLRDRIARMATQIELTRLLNARALSKVLKGERSWPEAQIAKLQWSHLSQALAELNVDLLGPLGILAKGGPDAVAGGHAAHNYPWQRFTSIGAGATEVQKNIIADRAIKLPKK
jgi:alkylation response protein AidB-like acyl-CoA dehydrogenase